MRIFHSPSEMQKAALTARAEGESIALVPTMGALHDGHLQLMREARAKADIVVVSIFVNPTQFGPSEDLEKYPRDFEGDEKKCAAVGVDWIFYPTADQMYPEEYRTYVTVEDWGNILCGASRPTHFRGVTTVVLKLFNICQPAVAVFGWKDAQQFLILRKMVRDLNLPVEMLGIETVREADGLAMSSRNRYLDERERAEAPVLRRALVTARELALDKPETPTAQLREEMARMIREESSGEIDYIEFVSMDALDPVETAGAGTLIALAVRLGSARLIDNITID